MNRSLEHFDFNKELQLPEEVKDEISWWILNLPMVNGKKFCITEPDLIIYSDASLSGWGACSDNVTTRGPWSNVDLTKHINNLEIIAAFNALKSFTERASNMAIRLYLDNMSSVCYLNKCGGSRSPSLNSLSLEIIKWCEKRKLNTVAVHLPGKMNTIADKESRVDPLSHDWMLNPLIFKVLSEIWEMDIDLFAASWNAQLPRFASWGPQPGAFATDAFSIHWADLRAYIFPPFGLIAKSLSKIRREVATVTFICPYWPSQFWFSTFLELPVDTPKMLSYHPDLLLSCKRTPHPSIVDRSLQLVAWRLSGSDTRASDYMKKLSKFCWKDTVPIRQVPTSPHGSLGLVGIWNETKIPCERI